MTAAANGNGNGNGNGDRGLTQRELLLRLDAKLDSMQAGLEAARISFAVHEAKAHHDAALQDIESIHKAVAETRQKLATYAGGIAVGIFLIEIALRFLS